jgi:hypothetical protein
MEHLQEVIDALVTLTKAGLLTWKASGSTLTTQPTFSLEDGLILNHDGVRVHVSREQACAIGYAAVEQRKATGAGRRRATDAEHLQAILTDEKECGLDSGEPEPTVHPDIEGDVFVGDKKVGA